MPTNFVNFESELPEAIKAHRDIGVAALDAASLVVMQEAKLNARGGFKTGNFAGTGWNLVDRFVNKDFFNPFAEIGAPQRHFAFWELGHHNLFTGSYERNRWLSKAFQETLAEQQGAAVKAARKVAMKRGEPVQGLAVDFLSQAGPAL